MAVIDRKKLLQQYPEWKKLSASARALLSAFERFTNKDGLGNPSWSNLMFYSGIVGKDTFKRARQQLIDMGIISPTKSWRHTEVEGRKMPRANIDYQITKSILWSKSPSNQSKLSDLPHNQSMNMGSMSFGKEGVSSLGVNKEIGVYKQPSAVNKNQQVRETVTTVGGKPTSVGETLGGSFSRLVGNFDSAERKNVPQHEWQVEAERIANYLEISNPSKSWFKLFRNSFERNQKFVLQRAAASMVDAPNVEDKERYFYKLVYKFLNER